MHGFFGQKVGPSCCRRTHPKLLFETEIGNVILIDDTGRGLVVMEASATRSCERTSPLIALQASTSPVGTSCTASDHAARQEPPSVCGDPGRRFVATEPRRPYACSVSYSLLQYTRVDRYIENAEDGGWFPVGRIL